MPDQPAASLPRLSIIVPCYNEAEGIPQLEQKLLPVLDRLRDRFAIELIFVDDGSRDQTFDRLHQAFGNRPGGKIIRHERNLNLGAAIRTGVAAAGGDWIAMLDSDCTYDPSLLEPMLVKMNEGADLVTVSPYHPEGKVIGVPGYRLFLSKSLTCLYRLMLRKKIYTFTALMRICRRDIQPLIASPLNDFSCLAEMMLKALKQDLRVAEVPAILSLRQFGESKMKTARVIKAHLRLISRLLFSPQSFKP